MFKECNHDITSTKFSHSVSVCEAACFQNVIESDDRNHLLRVCDAFESTAKSAKLDAYIHSGILHVRNVKKTGVAR